MRWWVIAVVAACGGGSQKIPDAPPDAPVDAAIDAPPDGPVNVTLTTAIGSEPRDLAFVAGQDGNGAWQALTGTDGVYALEVKTGRFAFAYVCPGGDVGIFAAATSELSSHGVSCTSPIAVTVTGSVANVPAADTADVAYADNLVAVAQPGPTVTYSAAIPRGRYAVGVGFAPSTSSGDYTRFILDRGVDVTVSTTRNYDFADAFALDTRTIAVNGGTASEDVTSFAGVLTDGGYVQTGSAVNLNPIDVHNIPPAKLLGSDVIRLGGFASDAAAKTTRSTWFYTTTPDDVALMVPDLVAASVSIPSTSPVLFHVNLGRTMGYQAHFLVAAQATVRWSAVVTAGWFGSATDRVFTTPDLTGVAGWDSAHDLVAGTPIAYDVTDAVCDHTVVDLLNEATGSAFAGLSTARTLQSGQITP
jgi:hypothetical protein